MTASYRTRSVASTGLAAAKTLVASDHGTQERAQFWSIK